MKITEKLKGVVQKVGSALVLTSAYGISAKAQITTSQGNINPVPMLKETELSGFLSNAINMVLILAGVAAVAYLIWGGMSYITAGGDSERAGKARTAITNAVIGVIIIIGALAIYNTVINLAGTGEVN